MKNNHILLLGSQSASRKMLLEDAQIPFMVLSQSADEKSCDWTLPRQQLVTAIAEHKMNNLLLPAGMQDGEFCFVLTADTLSQDLSGVIHGKPTDKEDARLKIQAARAGAYLSTAFCLEKKIWRQGSWHLLERIQQCVDASYVFDIPDEWIDMYLKKSLGFFASNAIAIEGFGAQFLRSINGSYTTIVGLPMFELRQALMKLNFFTK
jgi:septum formation protein